MIYRLLVSGCAPVCCSLSPGCLESLPRAELEQRLTSSMIMSEALLQQLTSARAQAPCPGPPPSDLRNQLVQTDHTELSQVTRLHMHTHTRIVSSLLL